MKRAFINLIIVATILVASLCCAPSVVSQTVTIDSKQGYILQVDRDTTGAQDNFNLYVAFSHCDTVQVDIQSGALWRDSDSLYFPLQGQKYTEYAKDHPPCCTEMALFVVHGGVFRKWIEDDGIIRFCIASGKYENVIAFQISDSVKAMVKKAYGWEKI